MSQFRNLVFEGGGVKGVAYAGAVATLEARGIMGDIRHVAGTSAGAISAALLAFGATGDDLQAILGNTDFRGFMDDSWGVVRDLGRLALEYGWFKGEQFADWMKRNIRSLSGDAEDVTFADLAERARPAQTGHGRTFRQLHTVATDLGARRPQVFSAETTPDVPVWLAVRMSMSIPLFFASVRHEGRVMVDGGVTWNYPIDLFDDRRYLTGPQDERALRPVDCPDPRGEGHVYNRQTLGFRVGASDGIGATGAAEDQPPTPIANLMDYANALVPFVVDMPNRLHLHRIDWHRTVFLEAGGVRPTDFDLSDEQVRTLVANGRRGTEAYFAWFDNPPPGHEPVNRLP